MRRMTGWLNTRSWETAMILKYVARHRHRPPGQAKKIEFLLEWQRLDREG